MAAADEQRYGSLVEAAVLELVDRDVGGEVVDAVERLVVRQRQRLGRCDADEQRAGQSRPLVTAIASTSWTRMPDSAYACSSVGTIASR